MSFGVHNCMWASHCGLLVSAGVWAGVVLTVEGGCMSYPKAHCPTDGWLGDKSSGLTWSHLL